jgi:hypothetical protein
MKKILGIVLAVAILFAGSQSMAEAGGGAELTVYHNESVFYTEDLIRVSWHTNVEQGRVSLFLLHNGTERFVASSPISENWTRHAFMFDDLEPGGFYLVRVRVTSPEGALLVEGNTNLFSLVEGSGYCSDRHSYERAAQNLISRENCDNIHGMTITFTGEDITEMYVATLDRQIRFSLNSVWEDGVEVEFGLWAPCQWSENAQRGPCTVKDDIFLSRMMSAMLEGGDDVVFTAIPVFVAGFPCRSDGFCTEGYEGVGSYSVQLKVVGATWR